MVDVPSVNVQFPVPVSTVPGPKGDPGEPGPAGEGGKVVESRAALASASTTAGAYYLTEAGRAGSFVWTPGNLSALVSADPRQGLYVAPSSTPSGASGAWVRKYEDKINVKWFGAKADDVTDDYPAFRAAMDVVIAMNLNADGPYRGGATIYFPPGAKNYYMSQTVEIHGATFIIEGGDAGQVSGKTSVLRFPTNTHGIIIQQNNTDGLIGTTGTGLTAAGTTIRRLRLIGGQGPRGDYHGIVLRTRALIQDVTIAYFQGHGIAILGLNNGNANYFGLERIQVVRNGKSGVYTVGPDGNAGYGYLIDAAYNGDWGIQDDAFLGNAWTQCAPEFNGGGDAGTHLNRNGQDAAIVTYLGERYYVVRGKETEASTTTPGTNSAVWGPMGTGGDAGGIFPTWVSGAAYKSGGAFTSGDASNYSLWLGCYTEGGQGPAQMNGNAIGMGGHVMAGSGWYGAPFLQNRLGILSCTKGVQTVEEVSRGGGYTLTATLGSLPGDGRILVHETTIPTFTPGQYLLKYDNKDIVYALGGSGIYTITGSDSARAFGSGAAMPLVFHPTKLAVPHETGNISLGRRVFYASGPPTTGTHARGTLALNIDAAVGAPSGWQCVAAGSPGTWGRLPAVEAIV